MKSSSVIIKKFNDLDEKQKGLVIIAAVLFFAVIFSVNIYKNGSTKVGTYKKLVVKETKRNMLRSKLQDLQSEKSAYDSYVVWKDSISNIKNKISQTITSVGVEVLSIKSKKKQQVLDNSFNAVLVDLHCTYHQLGLVVAKLESQTPQIVISEIAMRQGRESRSEELTKAGLEALGYPATEDIAVDFNIILTVVKNS